MFFSMVFPLGIFLVHVQPTVVSIFTRDDSVQFLTPLRRCSPGGTVVIGGFAGVAGERLIKTNDNSIIVLATYILNKFSSYRWKCAGRTQGTFPAARGGVCEKRRDSRHGVGPMTPVQ
jgi:hypothetical protein